MPRVGYEEGASPPMLMSGVAQGVVSPQWVDAAIVWVRQGGRARNVLVGARDRKSGGEVVSSILGFYEERRW